MDTLNIEYLLLAFLGIVIHACMKVLNRTDRKDTKFSLKVFLKDQMNWARIILSLASVVAILIMAEDLGDLMGITLKDGAPARSVLAFLAGYLNHSLIRDMLRLVRKQRGLSEDE